MKKRMFLTVALCFAVAFITLQPVSAVDKQFGVGSKAPALDIEFWVHNGNGFFEPVTEFEPGKVYVVEFWATWCGPCILSMPHLAELQNKFRGRNVQIVSVSDETLDEVKDLLTRDHPEAGKTIAEVTSAYCLTTDPDGSVHADYMEAAGEAGIPTAFIVGKTGQVEWIGHPGALEEPLEAILTDSWDREKFKQEREQEKKVQENLQLLPRLAAREQFDQALKVAAESKEMTKDPYILEQLKLFTFQVYVSAGKHDGARKLIAEAKGEPFEVGRFGFLIHQIIQQQDVDPGDLISFTIKAVETELESAEDDLKPLLYNTIAMLNDDQGDYQAAIAAQELAMKFAPIRQQARLKPFLDELKEKAKKSAEDSPQEAAQQ